MKRSLAVLFEALGAIVMVSSSLIGGVVLLLVFNLVLLPDGLLFFWRYSPWWLDVMASTVVILAWYCLGYFLARFLVAAALVIRLRANCPGGSPVPGYLRARLARLSIWEQEVIAYGGIFAILVLRFGRRRNQLINQTVMAWVHHRDRFGNAHR